jgi:hypothetical protein
MQHQRVRSGIPTKIERARTSEADLCLDQLADRLDKLAAKRARPWWRRLAG